MHPALVAVLIALVTLGTVATGGAAVPAHAADVGDSANALDEATNETVTTPADAGSRAKRVGYFFVRFGPSLLVVSFVAWILLGLR